MLRATGKWSWSAASARERRIETLEEWLRLSAQHPGRMRKRHAIAVVLSVLGLTVLGCGDDEDGGESATSEPAMSATADQEEATPGDEEQTAEDAHKPDGKHSPPDGTAIELGDSQFGPVLFDEAGQAIYLFDKETAGQSRCYGECAVEWPPVLTDGEPEAQGGISQGKLGVVDRRDGTRQVTYNGHPLYFYAHEAPSEVRCHNVPGFGGIWLALNAEGNPA